jgi:acetylglutamate kinase
MVLSGAINKEIASWITQAGATADVRGVGLSGKDAGLITVEKATRTRRDAVSDLEEVVDLGFVGEPSRVDPKLIEGLINSASDYVPVVAPIGVSETGETYNINADTAAGAVAGAVKATRLLMLTDVAGVLDKNGNLLTDLTVSQVASLMKDGTITGGMIPKVENCVEAVRQGVKGAVILDGRVPHACLLELFTEAGPGTLIKR